MSRYRFSKHSNLGPVHGFTINTPDNRNLKDLHPQFIVRELNRLDDRIKRLEGELESTKADRDSWSNQSDEFAKTAADLILRIQRLEEAGDRIALAYLYEPKEMRNLDALSRWQQAKGANL